jgi:hypothetical protein
LWIAGDAYPPRYPPGFAADRRPLLVGSDLGSGIGAVLASALAAIAAAYARAPHGRLRERRRRGPAGRDSPLHVQWSRAVMSDVPASAALATRGVGARGRRSRRGCSSTPARRRVRAGGEHPSAAAPPGAGRRPGDPALLARPAVTRWRKVLALGAGVVLGRCHFCA